MSWERELLRESAETFRRYEALHRAKGTDDSLRKAEVNASIASRIEAALAAPSVEPAITDEMVERAVQAFADRDFTAMPHHTVGTLLRRHRAVYDADARLALRAALEGK